ncbi:MAG: class I SAM-dependent methyltransferase [Tissierellia bacterium]|nr:class I SAM-dependent methyltransferase [Tissierellia bacterium]
MISLKNSERLKCILSLIKDEEIIADIGTDHGLLPLMLLEKNSIKKIYATDISSKSLEKLFEKIGDQNTDRLEIRVTDGLKGLENPYPDLAVIAGMGSRLIIKILDSSSNILKNIKTFIFQPNTKVDELRVYLHENGFSIEEEKTIVEEGRYYNIIRAIHGIEKYDKESFYKYGKILLENKDLATREYLESELRRYYSLESKIDNIDIKAEGRSREIRNEIEIIKEALNYYEA